MKCQHPTLVLKLGGYVCTNGDCSKVVFEDIKPLNKEKFLELLGGYHGGNPQTWFPTLERLWEDHFSKFGIPGSGLVALDERTIQTVRETVGYLIKKSKEFRNMNQQLCADFSERAHALEKTLEIAKNGTPSPALTVDLCLKEIAMYREEILRLGGSLKKSEFGKVGDPPPR